MLLSQTQSYSFFVFLLLCLSVFFGAVKKSIEQNVRETITANIDRQSAAFSSAITIQYQYLEGFAGYLGEIGELCSENVMTLRNPISQEALVQSVRTLAYCRARMQSLRQKAQKLSRMLEERKIIDRAKGRLMDTLHITEAEAHYHIQKKSMDSGARMVQTAIQVLEDRL